MTDIVIVIAEDWVEKVIGVGRIGVIHIKIPIIRSDSMRIIGVIRVIYM